MLVPLEIYEVCEGASRKMKRTLEPDICGECKNDMNGEAAATYAGLIRRGPHRLTLDTGSRSHMGVSIW